MESGGLQLTKLIYPQVDGKSVLACVHMSIKAQDWLLLVFTLFPLLLFFLSAFYFYFIWRVRECGGGKMGISRATITFRRDEYTCDHKCGLLNIW